MVGKLIHAVGGWLFRVMVAIDLLLAAICGCKRNESLSAASFSLDQDGKFWGKVWRPVIDLAFSFWQYDHCRVQFEFEQRWNRGFNEQS